MNHRSAQKLFLQFTMVFEMATDSLDAEDFAAYAEWLLRGGLSTQTVRNHFGAIKSLYSWVDNQGIVSILESADWKMSICGMINTVRPSYNIKSAMTPEDLIAMMEAASSEEDMVPLMVALTFGFLGYLRISNLAPPTADQFDITRHTSIGDIHLRNEGLLLSLKWSKSRQNHRVPVAIPLPILGKTWLCPFKSWKIYNKMLNMADFTVTPETPLLVTTHHPPGRTVTIPMLRNMFKRATRRAHLQDKHYTPHSMRRGGATFSYHAGVPIDNIKRHGTWTSNAVDRYLTSQSVFQSPVSHNFAKLLTDYQ